MPLRRKDVAVGAGLTRSPLAMGILVESIQQEFGVHDSALGLLTGLAYAVFYGVPAIPFGCYADRVRSEKLYRLLR